MPRLQSAHGSSPRRKAESRIHRRATLRTPSGLRLRHHDASSLPSSSSLTLSPFVSSFIPTPIPHKNLPHPQSSAHGGLRLGLVLGPGHGDADGGLCGRGGAPPGGLDAASGGRKRQCVRRGEWIPGGRPASGGCGVGACQGGGGRAGGGRGQQAGRSRCADGGDPRHLLSGE